MSASIPWVSDVLRKFQFRRFKTHYFPSDHYRAMVDGSQLVERMHAASDALNSQGDHRLLYEEVFVPPHRLVCKYVFDQAHIECSMSLVIRSAGPAIIFSTLKSNRLMAGVRRILGFRIERRKERRVCDLLIDPAAVSDADVQQWFNYLLSGLRSSFKPTGKTYRPKSI